MNLSNTKRRLKAHAICRALLAPIQSNPILFEEERVVLVCLFMSFLRAHAKISFRMNDLRSSLEEKQDVDVIFSSSSLFKFHFIFRYAGSTATDSTDSAHLFGDDL